MTNATWIRQLERLLTEISRTDRDLILRDVAEIAAELNGGSLGDVLGSPEEYARQAIEAFTPDHDPNASQAKLGPAHIEFRGPVRSSVRSRVWDPTNLNILTSHLFGIGWGVNLGAVAVKLGLIRPDDYDDATIEAIPESVASLSTAVPILMAATTVGVTANRMFTRKGSPHTVNTLLNIALAISALVWSRRAEPRTEDALIRNALASGATVAAVLNTLKTNKETKAGATSALAALLTIFLQLVVPVRAGLNAIWNNKDRTHESSRRIQ